MLFKRATRTSAETGFAVVQNVSGSTATSGYGVVWDVGANADGVRVTQASATDLSAFAGIVDSDIADNAYGLVQVYGYRSSISIYSSTGASVAGDCFGPAAGQWGVTPATTGTTTQGFGFICAAVAGSASSQYNTTADAFIRAL